jgi:3-oxoacyl-[acyl-carrier-protein] synthase II
MGRIISPIRVALTGIGVVSPIGIGKAAFWENLVAGKTGIKPITLFDAESYPSRLAGEISDFDPLKYLPEKTVKRFSRATQFALIAAKEALDDSGIGQIDPYRTDVIMGTGTSAFDVIEEQIFKSPSAGRKFEQGVVDPLAMTKAFANAPACAIALTHGTKSYITTVTTACASAINALGHAYHRIRMGEADTVITGSVDTPINHLIYGAFCAARFLTTGRTAEEAVCPFDERRTRRALGEGAGVFILEDWDQAVSRGAKIYAEITRHHQSAENVNELYMLDVTGKRWADHLASLFQSGPQPQDIDAISAHAPSDRLSDAAETQAIHMTFGACSKTIPVHSIKGAVGQGFSVAGAMQVASCALALERQVIPGTFNYQNPDPACNLDIVTAARAAHINSVLINAHGIGGINSSLIMEKANL